MNQVLIFNHNYASKSRPFQTLFLKLLFSGFKNIPLELAEQTLGTFFYQRTD